MLRRLHLIYDESLFGIFQADRDAAVTYANEAWREITGFQGDQLLGYGWLEAVHPADRARVLHAWRQAAGAETSLDVSFRIVRPDLSRRYVRVRSRHSPEEPAEPLFVGVVIDVTEQVLAERQLRRNNMLLSAILASIPCDVTVRDADGSLVLDKQKYRSLLDVPADAPEPEAGATDFGMLSQAPDRSAFPETADPLAECDPGPSLREETQADGRVFEVRDARMPNGGVVTTFTDISQHKQVIRTLEQAKAAAEQAAAAKAAFLAMMSHEIRTPMNGVIGMTNVLLDTRLSADQREIVDVIRQSGESLLVVINDILDYSKIESGQMELERLPLRIEEVVESSVRLLAAKAQEKNLEIRVALAPGIPAHVLGDRTRLQQVLVNLVSNAVKFTERGHVCISVAMARGEASRRRGQAAGPQRMVVTVGDTGIGIAPEQLEAIFEPFVQADSSTARRFGGTGLGLAIVRRLVEAMGGSVEIRSKPGSGTQVQFSFIAEAAAAPTADTGRTPRRGKAAAGFDPLLARRVPLRILVAEDNEINRKVALRMLAGFGYEADVARNGLEVIAAVQQRAYDLVFMDIQMPQLDGIEATKFIVANLPASARPRVVAMSANVMREHVEAALAVGADDYIGKPFPVSELRAALEHGDAARATDVACRTSSPSQHWQLFLGERAQAHLRADPSGVFLAGLIDDFERMSADMLSRIGRAVAKEDATQVRALVHEFSGMCAVMGAERLMHRVLALQECVRAGRLVAVPTMLDECGPVLRDTVSALRAFLQGHRRPVATASVVRL